MANNFEAYEKLAESFNNKYKVNFSFEKYDSQRLNKKNTAPALSGNKDAGKENLKYRNALLNIYKECVENMMKKEYNTFNPYELSKDFEKLMNNYRSYCTENGKQAPDVNGGWKDREIMDGMRTTLNSMNPNKVEYTKEKYLSGQLRLRDIKKDVRDIMKNGVSDVSAEALSNIIVYRDAIRNVVESRSILWKLNPFNWSKSSAEQRALKGLDAVVNINMENELTADVFAEENVMPNAAKELDKSVEKINSIEKEQQAAKQLDNTRVKLEMSDLAEKTNNIEKSARVEETKSLSKNNVMEV